MKNKKISAKTRKEYSEGIAAYADMQKEIVDAIKNHGGKLTDDEFDEEFSDYKYMRPIWGGGSKKTFMLNMNSTEQTYLQLAQYMIIAGKLDAKTINKHVVYSVVGKK